MKYLYSYRKSQNSSENKGIVANESVQVFTPKVYKLRLLSEPFNVKSILARLMFHLGSKGKARIYYVAQQGDLMHTSYVVPKCRKFPFLGENDYEIGPCFTYEKYRGRGIYPEVLKYICRSVGNADTTFYMIVDEKNVASVRGIEKAGFKRCGEVKVTAVTKQYQLVQKL